MPCYNNNNISKKSTLSNFNKSNFVPPSALDTDQVSQSSDSNLGLLDYFVRAFILGKYPVSQLSTSDNTPDSPQYIRIVDHCLLAAIILFR